MDLEIFHQFIIGLVCNFLVFDCGLHEGWPTPTLGKFGEDDSITLTSDQEALVLSVMYLGVGIGTIMPLICMDRIGRKWTLLLGALPKVLSWLVVGLADSPNILCLGRILAGIGCGISYSVVPMYIGEISSKRTRGPLGTMNAVSLNLGILFIYTVALNVSRFTMAMINLVCPVLFIMLFIWLPESAVYLTQKNQLIRAEEVLKWTLGKDDVQKEFEEVKRIVSGEDKTKAIGFFATLKKASKSPANRRACWIQLILSSAIGVTGAAPILSFQSHIVKQAEFHGVDFTIIATGVAVVISGIVCMAVVKFTGKRRLLLVSGPPFFGSLAVLSTYFTLLEHGVNVKSVNWIPSVFIIIYIVVFGFAFNPLPIAYLGELFSIDMKVIAGVCSVLYYAITTTVTIEIYQKLFKTLGTFAAMWQLTVITFIIWCLICVYVPETEGKSLAEIQTMLSEGFVKRSGDEKRRKPGETDAVDIGVYSLSKVSVVPTLNNSIN
ncbi:facilitated trehalose transporter Tret1 [Fopius arisanus]|uniref:Facilitated trehalose transporter Tret1 n=1 Tax=Fopius arisanus TaxID=64838 RepID=A0A0C9RG94_9HYME|nr:PREDICTED: facilitated trehalose transporter Tret1-like [Fopius arisanus]XP_011299406.1 PREDICTED: facilitated trehalose transporter Tret1-like [Fopius arisanus]XP_011299407.1 PREDICTED: facilitated trehalose transporter Tret1-like [Fopius arisanus]XP_011299408.1 PREDICTED: facilitated trehalose transporter Tret1-like [Fopius arisanus]XP_011299410.1 PREDICTED: facilitated trehalose transporter Tret1-like [Fopius arisanus]